MNKKGDSTLKICEQKLKVLNYSKRTIDIYIHYIGKFLQSNSKSCLHINSTDFQSYIDNYNFTSVSQQNQVISSIKFLYEKVLNKKYNKVNFKRPLKEKKLPKVIDKAVLLDKISVITNLKHKAILSLGFSVGLRVSEVINLKIEDIDSKRMIIYIKNAKGRKDRVVPLSNQILELLRNYFKVYKPHVYLFNGQNSLQYSTTSCNQLMKKYIGDKEHFHKLRHSCFTSLIENGTDIKIIQKLAGHNNIKSTEIYTHVSSQILSKINLPI